MEEVKAYKPKCCKKAYLLKGSAKRHEKTCFINPDNKACFSCGNFMTDYNTVYVRPNGEQNYGDADYEVKYHYCNYDDSGLDSHSFDPNIKSYQRDCVNWISKVGD